MKFLAIAFCALALSFGFSTTVQAEGHQHTPNVCVQGAIKACAHLGYEKTFTSSEEASFKAHVMTADGSEIQNFRLDLWMDMGNGHGHGSAPVEIAPLAKNMFKVTNAWFVMPGQWLVRLDFTIANEAYHIEIPVHIAE